MVLPVGEQADQQVGPAQQRAVRGRRAAERDVVAAAGAGVRAVEVELLGGQATLAGGGVQRRGDLGELGPGRRRVDVDLDDSWVRGDGERAGPGVAGQRIALEDDRCSNLGSGALDDRDQFDSVLELLQRRQEDEQVAVALLDRQCRRRGVGDRSDGRRHLRRTAGWGQFVGWIELRTFRAGGRLGPVDRVERKTQPDCRAARHQHQPSSPECPRTGRPAAAVLRAVQRQHPAGRDGAAGVEAGHQLDPGVRAGQLVAGRIEVRRRARRQPGFRGQQLKLVLVCGQQERLVDAEPGSDPAGELGGAPPRDRRRVGDWAPWVIEQRSVVPQPFAVRTPGRRDLPTGQRLARVPLALSVMYHAAGCVVPFSRPASSPAAARLSGPSASDGPLRRLHVVDRDEGRLAAHGQPDVVRSASRVVDRRRPGRGSPPTGPACTAW